jgi:hypothetical protein
MQGLACHGLDVEPREGNEEVAQHRYPVALR